MNDSQLNSAVRAAFPVPEPTNTLDAKINLALQHDRHVRQVKRRIGFGFAATAGLAVAFVTLPAVQAQAALNGIIRALDKQTHAKITTYTVSEDGQSTPTGSTLIANGDVAVLDNRGDRLHYEIGAKTYDLDPTIQQFIVRDRKQTHGIHLSDMLGPAGEFSIGKRADVRHVTENGLEVIRATIVNKGLPERYVIDADIKTDLPIRLHVDSLERGVWRKRQQMEFDYTAKVAEFGPDLKRYPATTEAQANADFMGAMMKKTVAEAKFAKGRVVVRAVDVAEDGTVFVAFQAGDRNPHSWRGYGLTLKDNLGTKYEQAGQFFGDMEGPFPADGRLEIEAFVPQHPVASQTPRTLTLTTQEDEKNRFVRMMWMEEISASGERIMHWGPNYSKPSSSPVRPVALTTMLKVTPTCDTAPAWAGRLSFMYFGNPVTAEMTKARCRGNAAMNAKRWAEAETQFTEELRLKREHERQGYGPWSLADTLENLDKVRAAQRP